MHNLRLCDRSEATHFLTRLFERFPGILEREEGAILLTHAWWFVPDELLWASLNRVRQGSWEKGPQAYGELLALRAFLFPEDEHAQRELTSAFEVPADDQEAVCIRIAFACAGMWARSDTRGAVTECLLRLIPGATPQVGSALMHVFSTSDSLLPDDATHRFLEALIQRPQVLTYTEDGWFIDRLEGLLPDDADAVYRLCREVVRLHGRDLGSPRRSWSMSTANLTNVALTLHRLDDPFRAKGLELFESLLDIRLPDAEAALREIDLRPLGAGISTMARHRPRRRRRSAPQ
jgi:hypothetical protein